MRKSRKALVVFSVSFFLTFAAIQSVLVTAQEWPAWVPTVDDIDEYELLWQNSTEFENYYDPDAENITSYGQFWYKNDTANEVAAIAAFQMMDFGEKPWNQEISSQYSTILNTYVPEFEGETSWDLMVYFLNMSVGGEMEDIAAELEWDKAVLMNFSGSLFDHLIV